MVDQEPEEQDNGGVALSTEKVDDATSPAEQDSPTFGESLGKVDDGVEVVDAVYHRGDVAVVTIPKDHFTLNHPTTIIRYRRSNNAARIIEDSDKQYILEEADGRDGQHHVSIRQLHDTSEGVRFLRATYALATAFWTGFLFVFCVQIMLFVFLDLAIQFGITTGDDVQWLAGLGVVFSLLPFIHGLASALVIAGVYVMVRFVCHDSSILVCRTFTKSSHFILFAVLKRTRHEDTL